MKPDEIAYWTKTYPEKQRRAREADLPRRLALLTPEATANWIGIIEKASRETAVSERKRPCDYSAWAKALRAPRGPKSEAQDAKRYYYYGNGGFADELMSFASDASLPGWPLDHAHLVDFALCFLEADVMLFRSGYTKRHLLRRLRQAKLNDVHKKRAVDLIKRAVVNGSGLEEFREFKRLTLLVANEDLRIWLEKSSEGAFLTVNDMHHDVLEWCEKFDDRTWQKLGRFGFSLQPTYAFAAEAPHTIVKTKDLTEDNRIKKNAWHILDHLKRYGR